KFFGDDAFVLGVSFIGVGGSGKRYLPFLTFARDFSIPLFIFSDGEARVIKELKKHYESVFGTTDIDTSKNITVLNGTGFEGYLISSGFRPIIEAAITNLDGQTAIDDWISSNDGTQGPRFKTTEPRCSTCKQEIYANQVRDYRGTDGYDNALLDILNSDKTRF